MLVDVLAARARGMRAWQGGILLKAILTDSHFWIPVGVLVVGVVLLVLLR